MAKKPKKQKKPKSPPDPREASIVLILVNPETGEFLKIQGGEPIPEGYVLAGA